MRGEGREGKMEERVKKEIIQPKLLDILSTQNVTIALQCKTNCVTCNTCKTDCLGKHI